eukprot:4554964-Alexandrium_andersonii.AAC.1
MGYTHIGQDRATQVKAVRHPTTLGRTLRGHDKGTTALKASLNSCEQLSAALSSEKKHSMPSTADVSSLKLLDTAE